MVRDASSWSLAIPRRLGLASITGVAVEVLQNMMLEITVLVFILLVVLATCAVLRVVLVFMAIFMRQKNQMMHKYSDTC